MMFSGGIWTGGALRAVAAVLVFAVFYIGSAHAEYNRQSESEIDLSIFQIDEKKFLGAKVNGDVLLTDGQGKEFRLNELLDKPLILALSYFKCDGTCPLLNFGLGGLLNNINRVEIGEDYNVLTLSFDGYDTPETLNVFRDELNLTGDLKEKWKFATFKNADDIKGFTDKLGYRYFWSPRDRTFFHPSVYIFISPQGRITRFLYDASVEARDMELAILEADLNRIRPTEIANLLVSYCYSYNYKEGKYTLNIPLFVGVGSLTIGVTVFAVSAFVYKRKRKLN
ncbi:MAG: hypothetical protein V3S46_05280 [Nitrospinota bacterium]